jgi:CxxC-x17-CxxC domain-containing protein
MANYNNRGNRSGDSYRSFSKPRFNNDRQERQEMFSAVCANCGKQCEVPFRPSGNKPVLCRDCFQNNRGSDSRRPERRSFDRPDFNRNDNRNTAPDYKAQFDMLNAKMDKILEILMQHADDTAPIESAINEDVLEEMTEEILEENKETEKKKTKKKKSPAKTIN